MDRHIHRQIDRQVQEAQTDRDSDTETKKHTYIHTYIHTYNTHIRTYIHKVLGDKEIKLDRQNKRQEKNLRLLWDFFLGFLCNCLSCFTTAKITFTSFLYPQFINMIYIISTSSQSYCSSSFALKAMSVEGRTMFVITSPNFNRILSELKFYFHGAGWMMYDFFAQRRKRYPQVNCLG